MSGISLDDAKEAKDEVASGNLRDNDAGITHEIDYENSETIDDVKLHPEVLVAFDEIVRISIQDYGNVGDGDNLLGMEQNLEKAGPRSYGFDIELTVAGPEIVDGDLWKQTGVEYPEFRIAPDPNSDENPYELRENVVYDDGEVDHVETAGLGQLPGGNTFDGERVELEADYLQFTISGSRGTDVLGVLDTAGRWFTDSEGNVGEGLFEVPPSFGTDAYSPDEDPAPRLTGYPELRSDMVGQRGAIAATFDGDATEAGTRTAIEITLFKLVGGEMEALVPLTPDDDAYAKPTYPRVNNTVWSDSDGSAAAPSTDNGIASAQEMVTGDDVTFDSLSDDGQAFVEDAVEVMEHNGIESVADLPNKPFEDRVESYAATSDMIDNADTLATIVENQL